MAISDKPARGGTRSALSASLNAGHRPRQAWPMSGETARMAAV